MAMHVHAIAFCSKHGAPHGEGRENEDMWMTTMPMHLSPGASTSVWGYAKRTYLLLQSNNKPADSVILQMH